MGQRLSPRQRRKFRVRNRVSGTTERPRLTVFRSARHIYAQVVDDVTGKTLATASTLSRDLVTTLELDSTGRAVSAKGYETLDARMKTTSPPRYIRRRPNTSPSRPSVISSDAKTSA